MSQQSRTDLAAAIATIAVGGLFLYLARAIRTPKYQSAAEALVGPAMVPVIIALLIIALGVLLAVMVLLRPRRGPVVPEPADEDPSEFADFSPGALLRLAAVVAIGFAYIWLLGVLGYVLATALVLALMLVLFHNRPSLGMLLVVAGGAAVYYYLFIRLMGLYLPAGWLINIG